MRRYSHHRKYWPLIVLLLLVGGLIFFRFSQQVSPGQPGIISEVTSPVQSPLLSPSPSPLPSPFIKYNPPSLPIKDSYAVFLVGDSMTLALGPHPYQLSQRLNAAYPHASFIIDNYSIGSVNIFKLPDLLTQEFAFENKTEPAILNRDVDILVIESFGNNPLSDLPLAEGLQKQREVMDLTVQRLLREKPNSVIILLATVAPTDRYAQGVLNLPSELRKNYAAERRAYIENFIAYANEKGFPLVNAYDVTRQPNGDAKPGFLNPDDYIHPSQQGIEFIQNALADYVINNGVIPRK